MPANALIPSVDMRLSTLLELNRRKEIEKESKKKAGPTITISREFGCEAYPMAECLRELLEKRSGESWLLMDKALLEHVARTHNLLEETLQNIGEKSHFLDEMLATFTPRWKSDKDYYRLLCQQIVSLASIGNVIIVGRGSAFITQSFSNCQHFRIFASDKFKARSIARRLNMSQDEAAELIIKKQRQRDKFIRDFLDRDAHDLSVYNMVFNDDKNTPNKIAHTIAEYVLPA